MLLSKPLFNLSNLDFPNDQIRGCHYLQTNFEPVSLCFIPVEDPSFRQTGRWRTSIKPAYQPLWIYTSQCLLNLRRQRPKSSLQYSSR